MEAEVRSQKQVPPHTLHPTPHTQKKSKPQPWLGFVSLRNAA